MPNYSEMLLLSYFELFKNSTSHRDRGNMKPCTDFPRLICIALAIKDVLSSCEPAIAFPKPSYSRDSLQDAFSNISQALTGYLSNGVFDATNIAVEITSSHETLDGFYWTAKNTSSQAGAQNIDTNTVFRIARVSKLFTALAVSQLHAQKRIVSLDEPVVKYVSHLRSNRVDWSRITVRDLLLNTGGIVDNCASQSISTGITTRADLIPDNYEDVFTTFSADQRAMFGLPPVTPEVMQSFHDCELNQSIPCNASGEFERTSSPCLQCCRMVDPVYHAGLLSRLRETPPVLAPHIEASNSNAGYSLLGLVIASVTGTTFESHISNTIIRPLGLDNTGFQAPDQKLGAVPLEEPSWSWDVGVNNPQVVPHPSVPWLR